MSGPRQGLRVIELPHIMAGPVCGLILSDTGADVVIENFRLGASVGAAHTGRLGRGGIR